MTDSALEQAIVLEPSNAILFFSNQDGKPKEVTYLNITNVDKTQSMAFKVKTTAPKNYQVKPFQGVLTPGGSTKVEITIVPGPENDISTNRFQIQARFTELKPTEEYMLAKIWSSNTKENTFSKKMRVEIVNKESGAGYRPDQSLAGSVMNQSESNASVYHSQMPKQSHYPELNDASRNINTSQPSQQTPQFSQSQAQRQKVQNQFESAPTDSMLISDVENSIDVKASQNMSSTQREIQVQQQANKELKAKINEIINKKSMNDGLGGMTGSYQWKDMTGTASDLKLGKTFTFSQALLVAIFFSALGYYLASQSPGPTTNQITAQV